MIVRSVGLRIDARQQEGYRRASIGFTEKPLPAGSLGGAFKLVFYAAKRGNLHSIFIVREIDSAESRNLVGWWMITFHRSDAANQ